MTKKWITAFEKVNATIKKLNGDWKPDWTDYGKGRVTKKDREGYNQWKWEIVYNHAPQKVFYGSLCTSDQTSFLLPCRTVEIAKEVIGLCMKELKILFKVD